MGLLQTQTKYAFIHGSLNTTMCHLRFFCFNQMGDNTVALSKIVNLQYLCTSMNT